MACAPFTLTHAQQDTEPATFSIMTLNVDGLPGKIFVFDVNADGPKSKGSERISEYMASKNCDMMCLQENFNYRWEIWSRLFGAYSHDEWSGGIIMEESTIDFAHLQNLKFECDGLNALWKKDIKTEQQERVAWKQSFGKFSHDFDDIITKGFRRYEMKLANGYEVVVYNMHMDASSDRDEQMGNDTKDREARQSQWVQLRAHILAHLDQRPVVVTGDMNSFYHRDDIKTVFIDAIEQTGKATVKDAWAEACNKGSYPTLGSERSETETLDHILYVNPVNGKGLELASFDIDKEGYTADGKPLGDHYPLIAKFQLLDEAGRPIGGDTEQPDAPKCATPTITYADGQLQFACTTEGATFISEITDADIKKHYDNTVQLGITYHVSVVATAQGFANSEAATATLCWIETEPKSEDVSDGVTELNAYPVLIQSQNGQITVQGLADKTKVEVYTLGGIEAGNAITSNGTATVNTTINKGETVIVKIGKKSVKVVMK